MSLAFPHEDGCPTCQTTCDDIATLRREIRLLRFLLVGALWVAGTASRPTTSDMAVLDVAALAAEEAMTVSSVLEGRTPQALLDALFPEARPTQNGA